MSASSQHRPAHGPLSFGLSVPTPQSGSARKPGSRLWPVRRVFKRARTSGWRAAASQTSTAKKFQAWARRAVQRCFGFIMASRGKHESLKSRMPSLRSHLARACVHTARNWARRGLQLLHLRAVNAPCGGWSRGHLRYSAELHVLWTAGRGPGSGDFELLAP